MLFSLVFSMCCDQGSFYIIDASYKKFNHAWLVWRNPKAGVGETTVHAPAVTSGQQIPLFLLGA